jgi:PHP family Zn ribbon phosphoesterase
MRWFKADLHIHTVLSPCGGLDMSPVNIIKKAKEKKLDLIAITDHNTTRHCRLVCEIGKKHGVTVIPGVELNTLEEIHCLAFFEDLNTSDLFQAYIDANLTVIPNRPDIFGNQFLVDEDENILEEENRLLVASLTVGISAVEKEIHRLGGICIPAHINRLHNGIYSQLGFIPKDFKADALEISCKGDYQRFLHDHPEIISYPLITSSDAHGLGDIGKRVAEFYMQLPVFGEIRQALSNSHERRVKSL